MLRRRLHALLSSLQPTHQIGEENAARIMRMVVLYTLGRRDSSDFRAFSKSLGITDEMHQLKAEFLDRSYYVISQFWRAVFTYFKLLPCGAGGPATTSLYESTVHVAVKAVPTIPPELRAACVDDMRLLQEYLTLDDHQHLFRLARATHFETPTELDLYPIVKKLQKFCISLAYRKMRFLINNDSGGLSVEDFATDLFEAALITLRNYDAEYLDSAKVLNFAKVGARNHCIRLIEFHTAQRRSRLVRVIDNESTASHKQKKCGTCAMFNVRDAEDKTCEHRGAVASSDPCGNYRPRPITGDRVCSNCVSYDQPIGEAQHTCIDANIRPYDTPCNFFESRASKTHYVSTTLSLETPVYCESELLCLGDTIEHDDTVARSQQWIESIMREVPAHVQRIVRITLGEADREFDSWLWEHVGKTTDELGDGAVVKLACEFSSVPLEHVRSVIGSVIGRTKIPRAPRRRRAAAVVAA